MVERFLFGFFRALRDFLYEPQKVILVCCGMAFANLVLDGSLFELWSLHHEEEKIEQRIQELKTQTQKINAKIQKASDPAFIEKEARSRFDLVGEDELVFVFSE